MDLFTRDDERRLNNLTLLVYILQGISLFTGLPMVVAVIINYLKRDDCRGTLYESHFDWQIRTFWFCLLGSVLGYALLWILVGFAILGLTWLWCLYRVLRGILALNDGKALPH
ncbi:hypothetical protein [Aquitalea sp. LB_tupeE]|uniref:DUF4870 family protein n=1 Tax=Aquitalea sp. LB_tupeE TaxID=2748078 RepID=UPI0015B9EB68|nr:hypothetical protein [Aquitalea sp. LB_tupeE]NWK77271.1 hypothetical protein [Aquitalea sp. LB_tupeE]